jgi:hypothetical protein
MSLERYTYEPGNTTSYDLLLGDAGPRSHRRPSEGFVFFAWLNAPGGGRAIAWHGGDLSAEYLAEKLFGSQYVRDGDYRKSSDLKALLEFLNMQGYRVELLDGDGGSTSP